MTDATPKSQPRGAALGENNGRLMAAYDCYSLASNPHSKGSKAHAAFVVAFTLARSALTTQRGQITPANGDSQ